MEWAICLNGAGEVLDIQRGSYNTRPKEMPLGRMFRVFPDGSDHCVSESCADNLYFVDPRRMRSWREREPDEKFVFCTNAKDELSVFANLQAWLKANGGQ
jgi:hypothetical protein